MKGLARVGFGWAALALAGFSAAAVAAGPATRPAAAESMRRRPVGAPAPLVAGPGLALGPGSFAVAGAGGAEEFFILSSLDPAHGRIVLKRPTEVTVTLRVNGQTAYRDEQGKALGLADLRAGATAYITYGQDADGGSTARIVRLGPMTVQVLHERYLKAAVPPR